MKNHIITFGCAISLGLVLGAYGGERAGEWRGERSFERRAVSADAAHYDLRSRAFTWGSPESVNTIMASTNEVIADARLPARKPTPPKSRVRQ